MSINSETAHLHQSNSQLLLSRTRLVIQSMINLGGCYKEKFMVTWPLAMTKQKIMRFPGFEPGKHGFKVHQDIHCAMEANANY